MQRNEPRTVRNISYEISLLIDEQQWKATNIVFFLKLVLSQLPPSNGHSTKVSKLVPSLLVVKRNVTLRSGA